MKYTFAGGERVTPQLKLKIKHLWSLVQTRSAKDLLLRVAVAKPHEYINGNNEKITYYKMRRMSGYYKNIRDHGFYDSEWKNVREAKNCNHVIQLFIKPSIAEEDVVNTMAHEWRHYLQHTMPKLRQKYVLKNGWLEVDARKYADKVSDKLVAARKVKPNLTADPFIYYRFQNAFAELTK